MDNHACFIPGKMYLSFVWVPKEGNAHPSQMARVAVSPSEGVCSAFKVQPRYTTHHMCNHDALLTQLIQAHIHTSHLPSKSKHNDEKRVPTLASTEALVPTHYPLCTQIHKPRAASTRHHNAVPAMQLAHSWPRR
eukprot:scaffold78333_cov17-Tisochrysis_lutea.AAC.1